jgi:hypothetical protein
MALQQLQYLYERHSRMWLSSIRQAADITGENPKDEPD